MNNTVAHAVWLYNTTLILAWNFETTGFSCFFLSIYADKHCFSLVDLTSYSTMVDDAEDNIR